MGTLVFEQTIHDGFLQLVGDPVFLGLILFGFFLILVVFSKLKLDGKLVILPAAGILALSFLPSWVFLVFGLILSYFFFLAVMKLFSR